MNRKRSGARAKRLIKHAEVDPHVAVIRRFNRFYTKQIGVLKKGFLDSDFSLTETRVLFELAHREHLTATDLAADLGLDSGYLSRMLRSFERRGLIAKELSRHDGRQSFLRLTPRGRAAFSPLDRRQDGEVHELLSNLADRDRDRLVGAMQTIESLLSPTSEGKPAYILRPPRAGDFGWVIHRQGVLYAREYGWNEEFESLAAEIVANFIKTFDYRRERCWIAERDDENVGSVFLVKASEHVAQLRLLLVEPSARGLGIGKRLVDECIQFARTAGYEKIVLWTNDVLHAARRIYERAGFVLVREERHHSFGRDLIGQNWELAL